MDTFEAIIRHLWAVIIIVNLLNVTLLKKRIKEHIAEDAGLAAGYNSLLKKFAIYLNLPWALMGAGVMVGRIESFPDIFMIKGNDPFILGWWIALMLEIAFINYWVSYRDGAATLLKYNRAHGLVFNTPEQMRTFFAVCMAGTVVGFLFILGR